LIHNRRKIVLVSEYDGSNYCGFQFQLNVPTVQDEIEKALFKLTGEKTRVIAASRTDAGVHAKGQVISFRTESLLKIENFVDGMNYYLPPDIAILASYQINGTFNVQRDAISRQYIYQLLNSRVRSPLQRDQTYLLGGELNIRMMNDAVQVLIGQHDFASFVTKIARASIKNTIKTIYKAQVEKQGDLVIFDVTANSFLPHQVRNMVGSLIKVALGKISVNDLNTIMEEKKPGLAGPTVPAGGLFLMQVNYARPLGEFCDENL
jgi:tRNA pseudouridine38-40 synthase